MSDFDKEAEREKLREKYGDEAKQRETTQQMSELLLQGATMTNRHCDECGDPVFRHQGQEFCPTCQSAEDGQRQETPADGDTRQEEGATSTPQEPAGDRDGQASQKPQEAGKQNTEPNQENRQTREAIHDSAGESTAPASAGSPPAQRDGTAASGRDRGRNRSDPPSSSPAPRPGGGGDLADAQASLERTIARFARQAEETEDPRAAKEHLAAAREAAEALRALRR